MTDPRPLTAGVVGWPITHSKSPRIFEHWFQENGIGGRYCHLAVQDHDFETVMKALPKAGFRGVNVTVPHKLNARRIADSASEVAERMGAANLLIFKESGEIHADNTDGYGFMENLTAGAPDWRPESAPAVVLGAGGATRAVVFALLAKGVPEVRVLNRTKEKSEELTRSFSRKVKALPWEARSDVLFDASLLVNSTSLGMTGSPALEIALDNLPQGAVVTDLVYAPLETDLLAAARERGNRTVDGLGMLLHQARPAFKAWFGVDPVVDEALREICLR
ncbi:MAG: shikimate dehydrogenase [Pseudomonadota bacterium]